MKKHLLILLGLLLLLAISCTKENSLFERRSENGFRLKISVEGQESTLGTRATVAPEEGEEMVQRLYLLFFEDKPAGAGKLINYYTANGPFVMNQEINIDFPTGSGPGDVLDNNTDYRVLAVANIEDGFYFDGQVIDWLNALIGLKESVVVSQSMLLVQGAPGNTVEYGRRPIPSDKLPMSTSFNKKSDQEYVSITLTRAVVRFDVHNLKKQTYDLVSVSVWNAYGKTMVWKDAYMNYTELPYQRFYGVEAEETTVNGTDGYPLMSNIVGKLYSFENFVVSPDPCDKHTTCLIIGMAKRDGAGDRSITTYYRVNVAPEGASQHLKRNNVYKISVNNILGEGALTELQAYTQNENKLDYNINSWNLDDNGMVLIDGVNTLVVPVKIVRLNPEGETREYSIFTAGPGNLVLSRVEMNHPGLSANLDGNRLTITGTPMANGENARTGSIVVTIGSLDATIDIVQSESDHLFLELSKSRTVTFPAYGFNGLPDGDIIVSSSGPWVAEIFNPNPMGANPGFSFSNNGSLKMTFDSEIDGLGANKDRFHIYTTGTNPDNIPRYSFVIVTLKAGNGEVNRSLVLMQRPVGGIGISPVQNTIIFNPVGNPATNNSFVVSPGTDMTDTALNEWQVELEGEGADKFVITNLVCNTDMLQEQRFTIEAIGVNTTGSQLKPKVKISLVNDIGVTPVYIDIQQNKMEWSIVTTGLADIAAIGGNSIEIGLNAPAGMHFTASIQSLSPATLTDHWACFIDMANSNAKVANLENRDVSETFKVYFPKLIWPNIGVSPQAVIAVKLVETGEIKTFIVKQSQITQHGVNIYNYNNSWGRLGTAAGVSPSYNIYFVEYLFNTNFFGPSGIVTTSSGPTYNWANDATIIPTSIRYVHYARPVNLGNMTVDNAIFNWVDNSEGLLFVGHEEAGVAVTTGFSSYILGKLGLTGDGGDDTYYLLNDPANKIIRYLTQDAPWAATAPTGTNWFDMARISTGNATYMNTSSVEAIPSAVPVLQSSSGKTLLMIDPKRNVVVTGESEIFQGVGFAANPTTVQAIFTVNLLSYIVNAAQYGSHFTDYFWDSPRVDEAAP
ncbi:MAG: hypothetical protein FWH23_05280 [Bacteroidales bacterium]|nr:hypothetical protein [Bacteroidales bacterium]